jgi:hypothetical protein
MCVYCATNIKLPHTLTLNYCVDMCVARQCIMYVCVLVHRYTRYIPLPNTVYPVTSLSKWNASVGNPIIICFTYILTCVWYEKHKNTCRMHTTYTILVTRIKCGSTINKSWSVLPVHANELTTAIVCHASIACSKHRHACVQGVQYVDVLCV